MTSAADIFAARILIVDDLAFNVALLVQMLEAAGYTGVTSTQDPYAVGELQRKNHYDLILLDLQMPSLDGFQVMADLQHGEGDGSPPILAITAQPDHKANALKAGAKDFISKPFELAEVLLRVRNLLEVRLGRSENVLNQARLENSQRIAALGDWDYDFAHHRLVWSDEVYRILGLPRQDFPASSESFYQLVHPEDLEVVRREKKAAAEGFRRVDFEHRIVRPDGAVRYVHQIAELFFDDEGRPLRESGTIQDITERRKAEIVIRESEERYRKMVMLSPDAHLVDVDERITFVNQTFCRMMGASDPTQYLGRPSLEVVHPAWHALMRELRGKLCGDQPVAPSEMQFVRLDGTPVDVEVACVAFGFRGQQEIQLAARDISARKKMEAQYLRAQRLESIGTLAGGIAHDLNNVLAPIMMSIALLKLEGDDDPTRRKILDIIQLSSQRGADLVRQVLSFARGVDGERLVLHVRQLLADLEAITSGTFPRSIRIVTHVPRDLRPIRGDPTQLHQVLLNLAVNSRDAMPHGGTLTLTAANVAVDGQDAGIGPEAKAGPYVLLEVTDTGTGIPREVRERIFEPFFTTKEFGQGTGIGLTTAHTIVKSHGGFIQVESQVGRGTTFKIYLPADLTAPSAEPAAPAAIAVPRGRDELVLVVDDEEAIRDITRRTLETFGYRVITAKDGAQGVALYARQPQEIAVVITDLMMPSMDGTAMIQVLTRINPAVKIIAASGLAVAENIAKALGAGAQEFLPKPYAGPRLRQVVRNVIDRPAVLQPR